MGFTLRIFMGLVLGTIVGLWLGPSAGALGIFGKALIQIIKALAAPLLFLVIVDGFAKTESFLGRGKQMIGFVTLNAAIALVIGVSLSWIFRPGDALQDAVAKMNSSVSAADAVNFQVKEINWLETFLSWLPKNIIQPFIDQSLISLVILAIAVGLAIKALKASKIEAAAIKSSLASVEQLIESGMRIVQIIFGWLVHLVPFVVFAVVAQTVGKFGLDAFRGLFAYLGVGFLGLLIQTVLVYSLMIKLFTKLNLKSFWRAFREPATQAFGLNSSLGALPLTLRALDSLKVSKASSRLGACVATNFNNDGILLYEAMAVYFIAQAHGIHLAPDQILAAIAACVVAGVGIAGIPEAGLVSLAVVLHTIGLPTEFLPFLLAVDWFLGRCRSVTNVAADMTVSVCLDGKARLGTVFADKS